MEPDSRVLLEPVDGSAGPLLRLADDRLTPGQGYGQHAHRDVDVVALVLSGSLTHRWQRGAVLGTGDRDYEDGLRYFQDKYPGTMAARIEFDPASIDPESPLVEVAPGHWARCSTV